MRGLSGRGRHAVDHHVHMAWQRARSVLAGSTDRRARSTAPRSVWPEHRTDSPDICVTHVRNFTTVQGTISPTRSLFLVQSFSFCRIQFSPSERESGRELSQRGEKLAEINQFWRVQTHWLFIGQPLWHHRVCFFTFGLAKSDFHSAKLNLKQIS